MLFFFCQGYQAVKELVVPIDSYVLIGFLQFRKCEFLTFSGVVQMRKLQTHKTLFLEVDAERQSSHPASSHQKLLLLHSEINIKTGLVM